MNLKKTTVALFAATSMFSGGVAMASDVVRPTASLNAKAPEAGVRVANRAGKRANQVEGGAVGAGISTGTIVVIGGVALVATAAGIWALADEEDLQSTP